MVYTELAPRRQRFHPPCPHAHTHTRTHSHTHSHTHTLTHTHTHAHTHTCTHTHTHTLSLFRLHKNSDQVYNTSVTVYFSVSSCTIYEPVISNGQHGYRHNVDLSPHTYINRTSQYIQVVIATKVDDQNIHAQYLQPALL